MRIRHLIRHSQARATFPHWGRPTAGDSVTVTYENGEYVFTKKPSPAGEGGPSKKVDEE